MSKIIINLRTSARTVSDMVRLTPEAQAIIQDIVDEHNVSARQLVSQMIIQGAPLLEFVREEG